MTHHGWRKSYPAGLVEQIRKLYVDDRLTTHQVAAEIGRSRCFVRTVMRRNNIPVRARGDYDWTGPRNPRWRTENLRYDTLHARVVAARGRPVGCAECDLDDPERRYEWANLTGNYEDVQDYARMCVPCHRTFDARRRADTGENTSPYVGGGTKA